MTASPATAAGAFLRRFHRAAEERRVPLSGSFDLTERCNLRCVHCYLGGRRTDPARAARELPTERWLALLDEVAAAGCLDLLLSGGEPLLRPDFPAIYRRARENGIWVTVFTNATLVSRETLDLFAELPPRCVEVSLYGATPATCAGVTGVPDSHARCLAGVRALLERGVPVALKTMILRENRHEIGAIEATARALGVDFRLDPALFPCADGGRRPLESRLDPADAVAIQMADPSRLRRWREELERGRALPPDRLLYPCGSGLTGFHVDPTGLLLPCGMLRAPSFDLAGGSFRAGWEGPIRAVREIAPGPAYPCTACEKRALCSLCPAFFVLESGSPEVPPPYACELATRRWEALRGAACRGPVQEVP